MTISPKTNDPSAPKWSNWSGNIVHEPAANGASYYYRPANLAGLRSVLAGAVTKGLTVRVSGQRHSQPPLVADDNRDAVPPLPTTCLVDMSCYADLGPANQDFMVLGPGQNQVTVNPGVREDDLDAFLTANNLMLDTVTAGGFFSIGGMTAVDVHGGTVDAPIFAETATSFTILGAGGEQTIINEQSKDGNGQSLLAFARVSLGVLGIVTRITLNVLPRPFANTIRGGRKRYLLRDKTEFVKEYKQLLTGPAKHARLESFFTPYAAAFSINNFLGLWWDVVEDPNPKISNSPPDPEPPSACDLSRGDQFGAPLIGIGQFGEAAVRAAQTTDPFEFGAAVITAIALDVIESQVETANRAFSDLWLAKSSRVIFMSYFIELPGLDDEGLGRVWEGLDVVSAYVRQWGRFHIAAPLEFRFVKSGDSAMSGAFSRNRDAYFVNLDLIGFVEATRSSEYPAELLKFFAHVERKWVSMGGLPHNGKMFGFYDPADPAADSFTPPFNKKFLAFITRLRKQTRQVPVDAFNQHRKAADPSGVFYPRYLRDLLEG